MTTQILICGANGYVGSRLSSALEKLGKPLRLMVRRLEFVKEPSSPLIEWVEADLLKPETLPKAFMGITTAYYLVHSMAADQDYAKLDKKAAKNFVKAAQKAGIKRVIFLGGLGNDSGHFLSKHLKSRHETGALLREGNFQVIEFRASIIIGPGSLSFELIRSLVERLPIMITPKWVNIETQPIFIDDAINYLISAYSLDLEKNAIFEIGGCEIVTYGGLMAEYAKQRGLTRVMIKVPFLTPKLSSWWLQLVTPIYARVGQQLIASLVNKTVIQSFETDKWFTIKPIGYKEAIKQAREIEENDFSSVRWNDTDSYVTHANLNSASGNYGRRLFETQKRISELSPKAIFEVIEKIGGKNGWYFADSIWSIRGLIDYWLGGIGMRRSRRDPNKLRVGDTLDFWRVLEITPNEHLKLFAEMRLPGRAWLDFRITLENGKTVLYQSAIFDPKGLFGLIYWYGLLPFHKIIFSGLLNSIMQRAHKTKN